MLNLTSNAVKFTSAGEVVVRARMLGEAGDQVSVRFEVSDTGVGIVPDDLERLFEPFSQADSSTTRRYGGTGLGLAIVKQLVELMHGTIGAESDVGAGSTFWFELPFDKQTSAQPVHAGLEALVDLRTLIVDDNATNRLILREQLGSWGMVADDADHAEPALEVLRAAARAGTPYDIVLLDLNMPDIDGLQLARTISSDATSGARHVSPELVRASAAGGGGRRRTGGNAHQARANVGTVQLPGGRTHHDDVTECRYRRARFERPSAARSPPARGGQPDEPTRSDAHAGEDRLRRRVASNGREGVEASANAEFCAILMDCQMPEMDGYQATAAIRRREGERGTRRSSR